MTKNRINLALAQQSIFDRIKQSPTAILIVFLLSSVSLLASGNEGIPQNNIAKLYAQEQGSTFRGAELLAYSPKKGSIMIKLQVYYSVFEHTVAEMETVSQLTEKNTLGKVYNLKKELQIIYPKPFNPESGQLPHPEDDSKIVTYSSLVEIEDSAEIMNLIWTLNHDAGLLNNVSLKENQNLSLQITLDVAKLNPGGNSNFLGVFPYLVVSEKDIDSTMWSTIPNMQLGYNTISTISVENGVVAQTPVNLNEGFAPLFPASKALNINGETKEVKVKQLSFGSYLIGLCLKENLSSDIKSHQAMYVINSRI